MTAVRTLLPFAAIASSPASLKRHLEEKAESRHSPRPQTKMGNPKKAVARGRAGVHPQRRSAVSPYCRSLSDPMLRRGFAHLTFGMSGFIKVSNAQQLEPGSLRALTSCCGELSPLLQEHSRGHGAIPAFEYGRIRPPRRWGLRHVQASRVWLTCLENDVGDSRRWIVRPMAPISSG